uniref:Uncharacterized protein n=1 Tax=Siphoviridae sp. ctVDC13 TaxID=2827880 RepID=A0A8S5TC52_9CAUD|nr:MAG TPA: hypothetical protein [Siphoviridae sp. ctVDC13]
MRGLLIHSYPPLLNLLHYLNKEKCIICVLSP